MLSTDEVGASGSNGRPRRRSAGATVDAPGSRVTDVRPTPALDRCIGVPATEFARRYWSAEPLLTPQADGAGHFGDLFSLGAVDELVSARGLRTPFLRMAKNGSVLAPASFTRSGGAGASIADQVADDKVLANLADGATLVLQALHRTWPPLIRFGTALAAELGHPVQINAYITPPQSQGFSAHYDTHDVFLLQVAGNKRWSIHAPVIDDPLPGQTWEKRRSQVAARALQTPLVDTMLRPGDALYLPRGYLHSAVAQGEVSVHLTVGVHPVTAYDLARELFDAAAADRDLRRSLPMGADPAGLPDQVRAAGQRLAAVLGQTGDADLDAAARRVDRRLSRETRPQPIAPLAQLTAIGLVHGGTPLRKRGGLRPTLRRAGDQLSLDLIDSAISWPAGVYDALVTALSGAMFRPGDLAGLDPDEQLVVARRLLREGVVVPVESDSAAGD